MRPILLDTIAYTAFKLGESAVVEVVAHAERLYLNSFVLGELLGGFARVEVLPITGQTASPTPRTGG